MEKSRLYLTLSKILSSSILCSGILIVSLSAHADTGSNISQVPLSLSVGVAPNMMFTLDDSTSMAWGYVPDHTAQAYKDLIGSTASRRFRASNTNPMYYNPNIVYEIPPEFDSSGNELIGSNKKLKTSFDSAPVNGYRPNNGSVNLSEDYKVVYEHEIPDLGYSTASHPFVTSFSCTVSIRSNNGTGDCKINNTTVTVRRTSSGCSIVTPSSVQLDIEGTEISSELSCSRLRWGSNITIRTATEVPAYYYEFDGSLDNGKCEAKRNNKYAGGEECYRLRWVDDSPVYDKTGKHLKNADGAYVYGHQNFANWYSFYKTRALATVSAAGIAFYDLSPSIRFTWQSLIHCTALNRGSHGSSRGQRCGANSFRPYTQAHKAKFYDWLYNETRFNDAQGTPLRSAMQRSGEFLKKPIAWVKDPVKNSGESYECRPSYNVIMTDGMWNSDRNIGKPSNHDRNSRELPDKVHYSLQAPYPGKGADDKTLADYAFHYWSTDLSTLGNKVPAYIPYKNPSNPSDEYWDPRNNPATWQHMSNFIMGLGLTNALNDSNIPWAGSTFAGEGYKKLLAGQSWPEPSGSGNGHENNIYDLWHAALNSRGEFYSVDSPEDMVQAFQDILTRIADRKASAAAPAAQGALEPDSESSDAADRFVNYFYQTTYSSEEGWAGDVKKIKKYRKWNDIAKKYEDVEEDKWSAAKSLPIHSARKIMIADGASGLQDFKEGNAGSSKVDGTLAFWLRVNPEPSAQNATWQDRLNYIRGDRSKEGEEEGKLRKRSSVLGDFLASKPAVVSGARYLETIANKLEGNEDDKDYSDFIEQVKNRNPQLYVGGNSGMLHAFDAETGKETFAFVPTAVFPTLNKLTGQNYTHQYYVDGSPVVADVYDGEKKKWRTILVGTLRAGGKGLFALDVTKPDNIQLLWELDTSSEAVKDLSVKPGYSFPKPTIARLHNGKWAVVTGNGYKGEGANNGAAALYIIDAISGEMIKSLEVQSATAEPNGLSTPRLADYDSDGIADYAYAGDLHGNLWRFDLLGDGASAPTITPPSKGSYGAKNGTTGKFKVSYSGKPLFTATSSVGDSAQPITAAPSLVRHPIGKGYLIVVGTGRYFEEGDDEVETSHAQSLYGIWDTKTKAEATASVANAVVTRGDLVVQSITEQVAAIGPEEYKARIISDNPVEWHEDYDSTKPIKKRGWYLDLQGTAGREGEMMIEDMARLGNTLFVQTLIPNDDPCAYGTTSWHYAINPATGGSPLHHAWTEYRTLKSGQIIAGLNIPGEGGITVVQRADGGFELCTGTTCEQISPDSSIGRQTWRVVPNP